jgi:multidrug transporter EmrE-like cation transporter
MNNELLLYAIIMLTGVFVSSLAQVLLKKAAGENHESFIKEYLNVKVIVAYLIFFGATLISVYAYKVVPLTLGTILDATAYIYVTVFGVTIFGEKLNGIKIIALAMIISGIVIYAIF